MPLASPVRPQLPWIERLCRWLIADALLQEQAKVHAAAVRQGHEVGLASGEEQRQAAMREAYLGGFTDGVVSAIQEPGECSVTVRAPKGITRRDLDTCFRDADFDLRHPTESLRQVLRPGETTADDSLPHDACMFGSLAVDGDLIAQPISEIFPALELRETSRDPLLKAMEEDGIISDRRSISRVIDQAAREVQEGVANAEREAYLQRHGLIPRMDDDTPPEGTDRVDDE